MRTGIATGNDEVVAQAATALGRMEANIYHPVEADRWLFLAEPFIERLERPLELRVAFLRATGLAKLEGGDHAAIVTAMSEGLEALRKAGRAQDPMAANLLNIQGLAQHDMGAFAESERSLREGYEIRVKAFGMKHPDVVISLLNLTQTMTDSNQLARAVELGKQARDTIVEVTGRSGMLFVSASLNLGEAQWRHGSYADAEATLQEAIDVGARTLGPDNAFGQLCLDDLAEMALERGQYARALGFLEQVRGIREKSLGADAPDLARTFAVLGRVKLKLNQPGAMAALERAQQLLGEKSPPMDHGIAKLALAEGLWAQRKDRVEARKLAEEALQAFVRTNITWRMEQARRWLDAHPAEAPAAERGAGRRLGLASPRSESGQAR